MRRSYLPLPLEWMMRAVARALYRVQVLGPERVPATGGVILALNHLSYADVIVAGLACPRRVRFIAYAGEGTPGFIRWFYRQAGVIPISGATPTDGIRRAVRALAAGELVCVFPEGQISRLGQLLAMRRGCEVLARSAQVPLVPAAVDGLWGSIFSFSGNRFLWKWPSLRPLRVCVVFGEALPPANVNLMAVRRALLDLGAEAFGHRPALSRHLAREVVRSLGRRPGAVVLVDRTAERRAIGAAQLYALAAVLARRWRRNLPERRVGIVLPTGAGAVIANLAVLCAGKVPVNLNFTLGGAALAASQRLAGVQTVITADAMRVKFPDYPWPEQVLDLRSELAAAGGTRALLPWLAAAWVLPGGWLAGLLGLPKRGDGAEAALLFTSGSAGEPKGVVLSHRNLLANCAQISSLSILPRTITFLGCLPMCHTFGFTVLVWYPLLRGCRVVTVPSPLDTRRLAEAIHAEAATALVAAPTFVRPLLRKATPAELSSLELVVTGAEKLPEDLRREFRATFHLGILEGYGLTETSPVDCVNQPDPPVTTGTAEPQAGHRAGSVGRLLPGLAARIIDRETGAELPETETGILCLKGANVFAGYLGDESQTRAALREGWFVTGDLARFDADGFLYIAGREARFSKIGGEMVPHGTVEEAIIAAFGWDQTEGPAAAVTGVPHPTKGEALVLLTAHDVSAAELRARLAPAGLPNLWIPRVILRVAQIPVLGNGKLDLGACRRMAAQAAGAGAAATGTDAVP
jgi:acyl-[acyl-carrier-protein]-phospholipid O-acyltransferase/long-chain-fatty-acid--[acyl-carrier-protein] ligase